MAGKSPISDEKWQETYERAMSGVPLGALDREFGFASGSVRKMLTRRFGYEKRTRRPDMTWAESDAIHTRALKGENLAAIARELGHRGSGNLYKLMANRYGYHAKEIRHRKVWMPTVNLDGVPDTDLAYIAGIIDGEGSIIRADRGKRHPIWQVKVNMTDRPLIEWLHSHGGTFRVRPSRGPNLKEQYEWKVHRQLDVQALLIAVLPYLRIKDTKAKEALAYFAAATPLLCDWTPTEMANGFHQKKR